MGTSITYNQPWSTESGKKYFFQECRDTFTFIVGEHNYYHPFRYIINHKKNILYHIWTQKWLYKINASYIKQLNYENWIHWYLSPLWNPTFCLATVTRLGKVISIFVVGRPVVCTLQDLMCILNTTMMPINRKWMKSLETTQHLNLGHTSLNNPIGTNTILVRLIKK